MDATQTTQDHANLLPEQLAQLRFKEAVRNAHKAIGSRELKMKNWLNKHPSVQNFVAPSKESRSPILNWSDRLILFAAGAFTVGVNRHRRTLSGQFNHKASWRTHLVHMALPKDCYARIQPAYLNKPLRGALQMSLLSAFRISKDALLKTPLVVARLMDAWDHRKEWKSDRLHSKEWFNQNVALIDAPFNTTKDLIEVCKRIVQGTAAISTNEAEMQNFLQSKQHDIWAAQLAKLVGTAANAQLASPSYPNAQANLKECIVAALEHCPWADKIPAALSITKSLTGEIVTDISYTQKMAFSTTPTEQDTELASGAALLDHAEFTRFQSIGARLEQKLADKPIYQRIANSEIANVITGGTNQQVVTEKLGKLPFSHQLASMKELVAHCTKHLAGPPLSVTARMMDRACAVTMHTASMANYWVKAKKLDHRDELLAGGYRAIKQHVEQTYGEQIDARLKREYPGISDKALAANKNLCVARTIQTALEDKANFTATPIKTLLNGTLQHMSVVRQPKPLAEMFTQPGTIMPNVSLAANTANLVDLREKRQEKQAKENAEEKPFVF